MNNLSDLFMIDENVTFLNHGSFGATPKLVFKAYQNWQSRLEHQPMQFFLRDLMDALWDTRSTLADYVGANAEDIVFVPNATFAVNAVARSLNLSNGDEVLITDHEYGACVNAFDFLSEKHGFTLIKQHIPLPIQTKEDMVEELWKGVTPNTKLIFISHITSPTALRLPVEEISERAKSLGILTLIDGAHAPGQIPLDINNLHPDFYVGNCHKWLMAPKGSAFLYTSKEQQEQLEPLIVSWGWGDTNPFNSGSKYVDKMEWWGTKDPAAYLAVKDAIQFIKDCKWENVREQAKQMLEKVNPNILAITGEPDIYPTYDWYITQMAAFLLPPITDGRELMGKFFTEYQIEIPVFEWNNRNFLRISLQGYNSQEDLDRLLIALEDLLPGFLI